MFRTQTGQTGTDAYKYEAAQLANEYRELRRRMKRLAEAIAEECDGQEFTMDISTERYPDATHRGTINAHFMRCRASDESDAIYLGRLARGLADPDYVVKHPERDELD